MENKAELGEVFFEMHRIGSVVRVTAVHAATGTEVVIQGPATETQQRLRQVALSKLRYRLFGRGGER